MVLEWIYSNIILLFILYSRLREEKESCGVSFRTQTSVCIVLHPRVVSLTRRSVWSCYLHAVVTRSKQGVLSSLHHSDKENNSPFKTSSVEHCDVRQTDRGSTSKLRFILLNQGALSHSSIPASLPPLPIGLVPYLCIHPCTPTAALYVYTVLNLNIAHAL